MNTPLILVVEDDRLIARDIVMQLKELGYAAIGPATTGEQAIEMAAQLSPQLVLMDIHLAGAMDGVTAAQAIHSRHGISSVFLSAFDTGHMLERAKQTAPAGYLSKPFMETELRDVVAAALKKH